MRAVDNTSCFNFSIEFILGTDASNQRKWVVLSQIQSDGQARVIAYASHLLSKSERHYCIVCKELLALIILNQYLLKRKFNL